MKPRAPTNMHAPSWRDGYSAGSANQAVVVKELLAALRTAERELNISAQIDPQAAIALVAVRAAIAKAEGALS